MPGPDMPSRKSRKFWMVLHDRRGVFRTLDLWNGSGIVPPLISATYQRIWCPYSVRLKKPKKHTK